MALYHKALGFPEGARKPVGGYHLTYTNHARTAAQTDKYGHIVLPSYLVLDGSETFELETDADGYSIKAAIRIRYNEQYDLCAVVKPGTIRGTAIVITVWLNERRDTHLTIKGGRYVKP